VRQSAVPARASVAVARSAIGLTLLGALAALPAAGCTRGSPAEPGAPADTVREWLDVAYATRSAAQRLDLYLPAAGAGPFPVVVWVHGGGWRSGDKRLAPGAPQRRVLERGYALASVNYRLSDEATFPAQIEDVKAAVRWLRANAARHRLDPTRIAAWGSSAGGHLVALLGTSGGVAALEGAALGNAGESSRVQAVVDWFGPVDFLTMDAQAAENGCPPFGAGHAAPGSPEALLLGAAPRDRPDLARAASPLAYIDGDEPPFLLQHGTQDCTVAWQQSRQLHDALLPVLGPERALLTLLPAGHGGPAFFSEPNLARVLDFLDRHLGR